jgi:hypothetical protein
MIGTGPFTILFTIVCSDLTAGHLAAQAGRELDGEVARDRGHRQTLRPRRLTPHPRLPVYICLRCREGDLNCE